MSTFATAELSSTVVSDSGERIGDIAEIIVDTEGQEAGALVAVGGFLGIGNKDILIPFNQISSWNTVNMVTEFTPEDIEAEPEFGDENEYVTYQTSEEILTVNWVGGGISNFFLPPGRGHIKISSEPAEANVAVGEASMGETDTRLFVKTAAIKTIELSKEGYMPCRFSDGEYEETDNTREASFRCDLVPRADDQR